MATYFGILRRNMVSAVIVGGLTISASPVFAQTQPQPQPQPQQEYRGTAAQQKACRPNVFRFCAGEIPNLRLITACLRRNIARLTPDCAAVFAEESH